MSRDIALKDAHSRCTEPCSLACCTITQVTGGGRKRSTSTQSTQMTKDQNAVAPSQRKNKRTARITGVILPARK